MKSYLKVLYQPLLGLLLVLFLTTALSSCEDHEPIDPNVHIGYVLCDDHSCMDTTTYFNQSKRKAVGVVFAEQTEEHPALVVMFKEVNEIFVIPLAWLTERVAMFPHLTDIPTQ